MEIHSNSLKSECISQQTTGKKKCWKMLKSMVGYWQGPMSSIVFLYRQYFTCSISGWWLQPLWKIWKSVGIIIPNIWKKIQMLQTTDQERDDVKNSRYLKILEDTWRYMLIRLDDTLLLILQMSGLHRFHQYGQNPGHLISGNYTRNVIHFRGFYDP
jgi:hypothetical protein